LSHKQADNKRTHGNVFVNQWTVPQIIVCDKPYHTNKRILQKWEETENLWNYALVVTVNYKVKPANMKLRFEAQPGPSL